MTAFWVVNPWLPAESAIGTKDSDDGCHTQTYIIDIDMHWQGAANDVTSDMLISYWHVRTHESAQGAANYDRQLRSHTEQVPNLGRRIIVPSAESQSPCDTPRADACPWTDNAVLATCRIAFSSTRILPIVYSFADVVTRTRLSWAREPLGI